MKRILLILHFTFFILHFSTAQSLPAFQGAEGWGANSKGGRGGRVIEVTNLNDSGEGSLRAAIETSEPRIVVFRIAGTVELQSFLDIKHPFITIAAQTAPGEGIVIKNYPLHIVGAHDVIVRGLKIRPGTAAASRVKGSELDGIEIRDSYNVIIDHCTVNWTSDEAVNNWHKSSFVTVQWCIIAEPLNRGIHEKGAHGYGASIGGYKTSFHHNLLSSAVARNVSVAGNNQNVTVMLDVRNCVIANWQHRTTDGKPLSINLVNNYYKSGPATNDDVRRRIARIDFSEKMGFTGLWYIDGNVIEGFPEISADNWKGGVDFEHRTSVARNRSVTPFEFAPVTTQKAEDAYALVLEKAGTAVRDFHEKRIVEQVRSGKYAVGDKGIIDKVEDAGGWNIIAAAQSPADTDKDGIPDDWETKHNLNPRDASDANKTAANGYTNIENYINSFFEK